MEAKKRAFYHLGTVLGLYDLYREQDGDQYELIGDRFAHSWRARVWQKRGVAGVRRAFTFANGEMPTEMCLVCGNNTDLAITRLIEESLAHENAVERKMNEMRGRGDAAANELYKFISDLFPVKAHGMDLFHRILDCCPCTITVRRATLRIARGQCPIKNRRRRRKEKE